MDSIGVSNRSSREHVLELDGYPLLDNQPVKPTRQRKANLFTKPGYSQLDEPSCNDTAYNANNRYDDDDMKINGCTTIVNDRKMSSGQRFEIAINVQSPKGNIVQK